MNGYPIPNSFQQPAAICALKTPADAIHVLEAVRVGLVPRVTRRLTGHERLQIRPGTVWVWEEEETNMRRWTDGRRWGASRVGGGGFLVYTESNESTSPPDSRPDSPASFQYTNGYFPPHQLPHSQSQLQREGLIKQTYSTTMTPPGSTKLKKFHVVAYSSRFNTHGDPNSSLPLPHQLPLLANLQIQPGLWPEWERKREETPLGTTAPSASPVSVVNNTASSRRTPNGIQTGLTPGAGSNSQGLLTPTEGSMTTPGPSMLPLPAGSGVGNGNGNVPHNYPQALYHPSRPSPLPSPGYSIDPRNPGYPSSYYYPPPPSSVGTRERSVTQPYPLTLPQPPPHVPDSRYHPYRMNRPLSYSGPSTAYPTVSTMTTSQTPGQGVGAPLPSPGLPTPSTTDSGQYTPDDKRSSNPSSGSSQSTSVLPMQPQPPPIHQHPNVHQQYQYHSQHQHPHQHPPNIHTPTSSVQQLHNPATTSTSSTTPSTHVAPPPVAPPPHQLYSPYPYAQTHYPAYQDRRYGYPEDPSRYASSTHQAFMTPLQSPHDLPTDSQHRQSFPPSHPHHQNHVQQPHAPQPQHQQQQPNQSPSQSMKSTPIQTNINIPHQHQHQNQTLNSPVQSLDGSISTTVTHSPVQGMSNLQSSSVKNGGNGVVNKGNLSASPTTNLTLPPLRIMTQQEENGVVKGESRD